jgi:predicted secreted protein
MSLWAGLAVYFVIWWTVLFCVLPLDVRSQAETGQIVSGTEPGAPVAPGLARKAILTTIASAVVFVVVYVLWVWAEM